MSLISTNGLSQKRLSHSWTTSSPEETLALGEQLSRSSTIVCLTGELGSGKTTFAKGFIASLTQADPRMITSPTFTYLSYYQATPSIAHFDLYRLGNIDEFFNLGFEEFLDPAGLYAPCICCIEWPERIASLLPKALWLSFTTDAQDRAKRIISWEER